MLACTRVSSVHPPALKSVPSGFSNGRHEDLDGLQQFCLAVLLSAVLKPEGTLQLTPATCPPELLPVQGFGSSDFPFPLRAVKHCPDSGLV